MGEADQADPLGNSPEQNRGRVYYADGVLLGAADFLAEQTYHRGRLARALGMLSGSGTVYGLRITRHVVDTVTDAGEPNTEEQIHVEPGVAIDPLGRIVEIPRAMCIRLPTWLEQQDKGGIDLAEAVHDNVLVENDDLVEDANGIRGVVVDLFLRFAACEVGSTPAFRTGPVDALDATTPERLRDSGVIEPVLRTEGPPPDPVNRWAGIVATDVAKTLIMNWQPRFDILENGTPERRPEHGASPLIDQTWIWLGRVVKPVREDGSVDPNAPARIAQSKRPMAIPVSVLAALAGVGV